MPRAAPVPRPHRTAIRRAAARASDTRAPAGALAAVTPGAKSAAPRGRRPGAGSLTSADLVVLSLLAERPMHGYELLQEYARQEVEDWAMISRPHVYYALKKLHQAKLIASARREARADARAVPFRVTPAGRRSLARALDDPAWATRPSVPPFTTWMGLSIHTSAAARKRVIAARTRALAAELLKERATLAAIRADAGERVGVAEWMLGLRVAQVELELTWLASPPP